MLYDDLVQPGDYICHYGVKGMKWGVRHEENKKADELGRAATALANASKMSSSELSKAQKRYDKNPSSKNKFYLSVAKEVDKRLSKRAKDSLKALQAHHKSLIKQYGKEHVTDIRYDKNGKIDDYSRGRVALGAAAGISTAVAMAYLNPLGFGVGVNVHASPRRIGSQVYQKTYFEVYREMRNDERAQDQARRAHNTAMQMHTQATNQFNNVNNIMNTHHMMGHF